MTAAVVLIGIAAAFGIGKLTGVSSPKGQGPQTQDIGGTSVPIKGPSDIAKAHEEPLGAVTAPSTASDQPERVAPSPEASGGAETVLLPGDVPLDMVWIPAGTFLMGYPDTEQDPGPVQAPQHQVTLSRGFWMGKYEFTQAQWLAVMGSNPSNFTGDLSRPVEQVSWNDIQGLLTTLNAQTGKTFRLPTEAEWEYACRAGTTTRFYWGDDAGYTEIGNYAWSGTNSDWKTHPVGQKMPNAWGLYDMSGNVCEWCQDWCGGYPSGPVTDPAGPSSSTSRVYRGGQWNNYPKDCDDCRSAYRCGSTPDARWRSSGFRVVRTS
jgi:formylglycine-generating enzyme required for sulfatase activity